MFTQQKYIGELMKKAGMVGCAACHTPLSSTTKISALRGSSFHDPSLYRSVVGSLQYLTIIRPEISYCVNKLARFVRSPLDSHWKMVKCVLRYLNGIACHGLHLKKDIANAAMRITTYSDSDWAVDLDDRKLTTRYYVFLGPNLVSWALKKQTAVARSITITLQLP
ncbi:uncharacterized mitochondrial protein AtMg00810-like [Arachis hypogaea]|uniref:uncharacterized mitochondrial protein AtMg00810-like n=1 Tax=Arachis hypogaea TaxID=3818 RepID=UPI003B21DFAD